MYQVRFHGRGGQGVVTAAELLAAAAFAEGRHAQAFPSFGSERTGAPVQSYCRISDVPIRTREPISEPDAVVVQDATVLAVVDCLAGLAASGAVVVNSSRRPDEIVVPVGTAAVSGGRLVCVPATELAMAHTGRPVPNAVLLGGFAALCPVVSLASVLHAIAERFSEPVAATNQAAATEAYHSVHRHLELVPRGAGRG